MRANNDDCPEALLAIVDTAAAERVVRLASPGIQEERPFQFFDLLMRGISVLLFHNPEDLYEDNRDWYEDEDEAWDEWYDD